eukprot:CAMPEP_0119326822 /NCGR_PEP_ID=MMETSP1333-20130426/69392_1 /TAXON_ID=418940 /ORGANISM="Scyphosphaera apsteinii, Strain RCC1455" /LENGTH=104 /DNA_ID=CAMNT_0007335241 /DNA_START=59 /DNA_END=370 /DNA_ORIENTATION=+
MTLRELLRLLPCQSAEAKTRFHEAVLGLFRGSKALGGHVEATAAAKEVIFHLNAQRTLRDLNERYFPQSQLTERERVAKMAKLVGLQPPEWDVPPSSAKQPESP